MQVVDVKALKEALHTSITGWLGGSNGSDGGALAFQHVISGLQEPSTGENGGATGVNKFKDLSVHLCFICLLHLANDHSLSLCNSGELDQLSISSMR